MRQPKALPICFLTEMWERFGFYIVEGLLILFMTHALNFSDNDSYTILGEFSALVYITPILGGYLADKFLGFRFAVVLGGMFLAIGYAVLVAKLLFLGLAFIIVGNGLLKSNISGFLGTFYSGSDARRDSGFTIFYIGINVGVFLSTLLGGLIVRYFGWYSAFGIASAGMVMGVVTFIYGFKYFENNGLSPTNPEIKTTRAYLIKKPLVLLGLAAVIALVYASFLYPGFADIFLEVFGAALLTSLLILAFRLKRSDCLKMLALMVMTIIAIIFWGIFFEVFFAVNLFTDRAVDRVVMGFDIPAVAFISLEAVFILILGPLLASFWKRTHGSRFSISAPYKFCLAFLILGVGMQILVSSIHATLGGLVAPVWLVFFYLMVTISELLLSPIGIAMFTEYSPKRYLGLMMGVWFISLGFGGKLSGMLAQMANFTGDVKDVDQLALVYSHAFQNFAWLAYASALLMLIMSPILVKLVKDR